MDNYFTSFRLFTHLGVNSIPTKGVLNKNRSIKTLSLGTNNYRKKRNVTTLNSAHQAKKKGSATLTVVGYNGNRVIYIAFSEFSEPKRFVRR